MKEKIKEIFSERWLSTHISTVLIIFGGIVFLIWLIPLFNLPLLPGIELLFGVQEIKGIISTQYMLTTLGAVFAFWYGYKKYESEKSKEIIGVFIQKSYGEVQNTINTHTKDGEFVTHGSYIDFLYIHYLLKEQGYIKENDWGIIEDLIVDHIALIIIQQESVLRGFLYDIKNNSGIKKELKEIVKKVVLRLSDAMKDEFNENDKDRDLLGWRIKLIEEMLKN